MTRKARGTVKRVITSKCAQPNRHYCNYKRGYDTCTCPNDCPNKQPKEEWNMKLKCEICKRPIMRGKIIDGKVTCIRCEKKITKL